MSIPYHVSAFMAGLTSGQAASHVRIMSVPAKGYEFVREIAPRDGDVLMPKKHPSA